MQQGYRSSLPKSGPVVENPRNSLRAERDKETKKKKKHIFVKSIVSSLHSESKNDEITHYYAICT